MNDGLELFLQEWQNWIKDYMCFMSQLSCKPFGLFSEEFMGNDAF